MLRAADVRSWLAIVAVVTAVSALLADTMSTVRLPPRPSKRSRARDTPVLPHVPGGGPDGGMVDSIALTRSTPARVFVALRGGGIYASSDRGVTWVAADLGLPLFGCNLLADPVAGQTLYATCGNGLFKTTDGGELWRQLDIDDPELPVIAASNPHMLFQPPFDGLVISRDGGRRWTRIPWPRRAQKLCRARIVVDPSDASTLYCPSGTDVLVSRDEGVTWRPLPGSPFGVGVHGVDLAIARANRRTMFVTTDDRQVLKTTTGGHAWTSLTLPDTGGADDVRLIDDEGDVVYARQIGRLVRSLDGGATWNVLSAPWPGYALSQYAVDPEAPDTVYAATSAGVYVSSDGGRSWATRTVGITRASSRVAFHDGPRATVFASSGRDLFTSEDDGESWSPFERNADMGGIDGSTLTSDGDGGVLVRAGAGVFRLPRGSTVWTPHMASDGSSALLAVGRAVGRTGIRTERDRFTFTLDGGVTWQSASLPGGVAPSGVAEVGSDQRVLIAGVGGLLATVRKQSASLWRSADRGVTWQRVRVASEHVTTGCCGLLVDPGDTDAAYAVIDHMTIGGGSAPELLRSVDAGATWFQVQHPSLSGAIALLPTSPTTVLAQAYRGDFVRSTDRGAHWTWSVAVLPEHISVVDFAFDPRRPAVVFAATKYRGVYRSTDAGATWQPTGRVRQRQ